MDADLGWSLGHGAGCAFSTRADGDLRDPLRRPAWLRRVGACERNAVVRQVHGALVADADAVSGLADADAQVSCDPGLALVAFGADCPGLCIAAPDALGIAHCGWRGAAAGIVGALIAAVAGRSRHPPASFSALIGPGIAGDDYEVDQPVLSARVWPAAALRAGRADHAWLDLAAAIAADARAAGVMAITIATPRTSRDPRLWSYRRDGAGMVQGLAIWRSAAARASFPRDSRGS